MGFGKFVNQETTGNSLGDQPDNGALQTDDTLEYTSVDNQVSLSVNEAEVEHDQLKGFNNAKHAELNDTVTSSSTLWSSAKTAAEIAGGGGGGAMVWTAISSHTSAQSNYGYIATAGTKINITFCFSR